MKKEKQMQNEKKKKSNKKKKKNRQKKKKKMMTTMTMTMMTTMTMMMMSKTMMTVTVMPPGRHQGRRHARLDPVGSPLHLLGDGDGPPVVLSLPHHPLQGLGTRVPLYNMLPNLGEGDCQNIYSLQALYTKIGTYLCIYLVREC